jgi:hypothetical protein
MDINFAVRAILEDIWMKTLSETWTEIKSDDEDDFWSPTYIYKRIDLIGVYECSDKKRKSKPYRKDWWNRSPYGKKYPSHKDLGMLGITAYSKTLKP